MTRLADRRIRLREDAIHIESYGLSQVALRHGPMARVTLRLVEASLTSVLTETSISPQAPLDS